MYAEIALSCALSLFSFVSGITTRRSRQAFTLAPPAIICTLCISQVLILKKFESSKAKKIVFSIALVLSNILGRSLQMVGLTGGISCGKSTVVSIVKESFPHVAIIDCDLIAREVIRPGRSAYKRLVAAFGRKILMADGSINRQALGDIIFSDIASRRKLDRIVQPVIFYEVISKLLQYRLQGFQYIVLDAPLLFESKIFKYFCCPIVTIYINDKDLWIKRLCERDLIPIHQAKAKIACQMLIEDKLKLSDICIENSGSIYMLENNVVSSFRKIFNV